MSCVTVNHRDNKNADVPGLQRVVVPVRCSRATHLNVVFNANAVLWFTTDLIGSDLVPLTS